MKNLNEVSPHLLYKISKEYGISYEDLMLSAGHVRPSCPMNVVEGISRQVQRVSEIGIQYQNIGPAGGFGAAWIRDLLERTHVVVGEGDVTQMLKIWIELREVKA